MQIPIFLFNGFLESGKTSFMMQMLRKPVFTDGKNTLVISCEEGVEDFEEDYLQANHISLVTLEGHEELTDSLLWELDEKSRPSRVLIEYNGMWDINSFLELNVPKGWFIYQMITVVNGESFGMYMSNMRSLMMEHFRLADLVLINRTAPETNLSSFRGNVKAVNGQARLFICTEDFQLDPIREALPYDVEKDPIEVEMAHYGIWYIDMWEHPEVYQNKKVRVSGLFMQHPDDPKDRFSFGRFAMPCCEDDVTLMGVYCHNIGKAKYQNRDSITIEATIHYEKEKVYNESVGPVLYVKQIQQADRSQEAFVVFE